MKIEDILDMLTAAAPPEKTVNKLCLERIRERIVVLSETKTFDHTHQLEIIDYVSKLNDIAFADRPNIALIERFTQTMIRTFMVMMQATDETIYKSIEELLIQYMMKDAAMQMDTPDDSINGKGLQILMELEGGTKQ